ncbi:MAG: nucleotidyl transferase AbiEii/AbiGii toxin family protein [Candidatus Micrarchaeota archaeon]
MELKKPLEGEIMEVNLNVCKTIAIQHGLPLQFVIKEFHLFNVLSQVVAFASQNNRTLVFKGGTALSKVYLGKAQRFSEDIDFDLEADIEKVMHFSKELAGTLKEYSITEFRKVHNTVQFYCKYDNLLGGKDHIRVDIASKPIITSKPLVQKQAVSEFIGSSVSGFYVYDIEDLLARKMNALSDRAEGKDFYDVYMGLPRCKQMGNAIASALKSEKKKETVKEFLQKTIEKVGKADPKKLRNLTNPFIPLAYRPKDWLELKNDLLLKLEELEI